MAFSEIFFFFIKKDSTGAVKFGFNEYSRVPDLCFTVMGSYNIFIISFMCAKFFSVPVTCFCQNSLLFFQFQTHMIFKNIIFTKNCGVSLLLENITGFCKFYTNVSIILFHVSMYTVLDILFC